MEDTEGRGRGNQGCANGADSGCRRECGRAAQATAEDGFASTTDGTEGNEPRDEAGGGSREGGIGGRAGEGRTIHGRKRIPARGAAGDSEKGCKGEKRARAKPILR